MRNDDVAFIGAYRNLGDVVPLIGQPSADAPSDGEIMKELVGVGFDEIFWAPEASADAALRRYIDRAKELINELRSPRVWDASDTKLS
jgi:hypothetical protein